MKDGSIGEKWKERQLDAQKSSKPFWHPAHRDGDKQRGKMEKLTQKQAISESAHKTTVGQKGDNTEKIYKIKTCPNMMVDI